MLAQGVLYNYWHRTDGTNAASSAFLDLLETASLIRVLDSRSPFVLSLSSGGRERSRIYGSEDSKAQLEALQRGIIEGRLNRNRKD